MSLSSGSDAARVNENATTHPAPTPKRRRLNLACNYCRSRKTRCDEQKPSCHACLAAGLACVTTDPRRPNQHVERREAGKGPDSSTVSQGSAQTAEDTILLHQPAVDTSPASAPVLFNGSQAELPARVEEQELGSTDGGVHTHKDSAGHRFSGLLPIIGHDNSSTSLGALTGWLRVASSRLGLGHRFGRKTPYNADQYHEPFPTLAPSVSDLPDLLSRFSNYFQTVHPVYPVVDEEEVYTTFERLQARGISTLISNPECLPQVVMTLVVLDIGSGGLLGADSDTHDVYTFLKDLIGRLIGRPTLPNIKAIFLLAMDMYQHDDLAAAWSTVTLCTSMATAVGLDKSRTAVSAHQDRNRRDETRTWWSIFILEKFISFEIGRKSSISSKTSLALDSTLMSSNEHVGNSTATVQAQPEYAIFSSALLCFAHILGKIGERCIDIRNQEEVASDKEQWERIIAEKLKITGESCVELNNWAERLPEYLRPGSDLIYDRRTFPHAAFISIHYYNVILVLTRNSLLISGAALRDAVEGSKEPWGHILRNGQPMAASTARRLVKLFVEAEESEASLLIPYTNAPLHALYVLAVHLMRYPETMLRKTDLDLLKKAARFAKHRIQSKSSSMQNLCSILSDIDRILGQSNETNAGPHRSGSTTPSEDLNFPLNSGVLGQALQSEAFDLSLSTLPDMSNLSDDQLLDRFSGLDGYNNNTLYYHGMDIGAWMGLDGTLSIRSNNLQS